MIPERINQISKLGGFPLWIGAPKPNKMCEMVRVTGFSVEPDKEHIHIFLPQKMFDLMEPLLKDGIPVSLLMASISDFESYQVKGIFKGASNCSMEDMQEHQFNLQETIREVNKLGLLGNGVFGYLLTPPIKCIRIKCKEVFEQTPKPSTGARLKE